MYHTKPATKEKAQNLNTNRTSVNRFCACCLFPLVGKCRLCWDLTIFNLPVYCSTKKEGCQDFSRFLAFPHIAQKLFQILFILPLTFSYFSRLKQNGYPPPPLTLAFSVLLCHFIFFIVLIIIALSQGFTIGKLHKLSFSFCALSVRPFPAPTPHIHNITINARERA